MKLRITAYWLFPGISEIYSGEAARPRAKISGVRMIAVIARSAVSAGFSAKRTTSLSKFSRIFTLDLSRPLKLTTLPNEQPKR